jgi:hypothetical protein
VKLSTLHYHSLSCGTHCNTSENVCLGLHNCRYSIYILYITWFNNWGCLLHLQYTTLCDKVCRVDNFTMANMVFIGNIIICLTSHWPIIFSSMASQENRWKMYKLLRKIKLCFCFVFLRLVCPMLPVSLDFPFLIAPLIFSNVYFIHIHDENKLTNKNRHRFFFLDWPQISKTLKVPLSFVYLQVLELPHR